MAYTTIVFNATDAWHKPVYSFKVNMLTHELAVEYCNNTGGITTNGIVLTEHQYKHIERLASPTVFEKFRDEKWKEHMEWMLDPNDWKAQFVSDDGIPVLTMETNMEPYPAPAALIALVKYVMHISTLGNMEWKLF